MPKTSTTVGPTAYAQWRSIRWLRKEAALGRMVGKRLDIAPRRHDYADPTEVEQAIAVLWRMDKFVEESWTVPEEWVDGGQ